ncbi:two-component system response regulator KdpE [Ramlibacter solisilvae]|uniref:Transcriptional regulator n=1 Tax=Ramlibacter tataouinensis TaxID=94132 RepID=A0A127JVU5_9BURK|nr:response regulator [Ramlibacter tataouinensis]AMO24128.1 transcriptional regulator [Ramlibacter tataouinensis]
MAEVLVVEDDSSISQFVCASLSAAGMRPRAAHDAAQAQRELATGPCELLIVDLGLPDMDGVELIGLVRQRLSTPILVLSARTQEAQKIAALDAGADDYLTKPFGVGELLARVRAMLRRAATPPQPAPVLRVADLVYERESRQVSVRGRTVHLTPLELELFDRLAASPGKVLTHRQLLAQVWGSEHVDQLHYLRIYMGHLRAKIEEDPADPRYLLTELGVGYRLADE